MDDYMKNAVEYYNEHSIKPYVYPFVRDASKIRELPKIPSIFELNREMESFVIQEGAGRSLFFRDRYRPLQFIHFSDVHAVMELWNRTCEYLNHYDSIAFALHTGDYCEGSQEVYAEMYRDGLPHEKPVLNCVGNHDTVDRTGETQPKASVHERLFSATEDWGVTFMEIERSMTYYRDFPESGIRLIVLDLYYDLNAQNAWLLEILADAKEKGLYVMTAMHEPSAVITESVPTAFESITDFSLADDSVPEDSIFEETIAAFLKDGGKYICNLCGHLHHDRFGFTKKGVMNVSVESSSDWAGWCDGIRVRGTRTYDCFNVVAVDVNLGVLKLVRIGDNVDVNMREKRALCYDFVHQRLITG